MVIALDGGGVGGDVPGVVPVSMKRRRVDRDARELEISHQKDRSDSCPGKTGVEKNIEEVLFLKMQR